MKSRLVWCQPGPGAVARPGLAVICGLTPLRARLARHSPVCGAEPAVAVSPQAQIERSGRPFPRSLAPYSHPQRCSLPGARSPRPARRGPLRSPPRLRPAWGGDCPARKYSAPSDIGLFKCARMLPESENELPESALFRPARSPGRNQRTVGKYASNELSS